MYMVTSNGMLKKYDPQKAPRFRTSEILSEWKLPHDKNDPTLPENHPEDCENCHEMRQVEE